MRKLLIILFIAVTAEYFSQSITYELNNDEKFEIRDHNSVLITEADGTSNIRLKGNLTIANGTVEYKFPDADGKRDQVLKTDSKGNLNWIETEEILTFEIYYIICTKNSELIDGSLRKNSFAGEVRIVTNYASYIIPSNFLFCDGRELQIEEYTELYEVLGTIYGGDGIKTFRLPDFRGKIPAGF